MKEKSGRNYGNAEKCRTLKNKSKRLDTDDPLRDGTHSHMHSRGSV